MEISIRPISDQIKDLHDKYNEHQHEFHKFSSVGEYVGELQRNIPDSE